MSEEDERENGEGIRECGRGCTASKGVSGVVLRRSGWCPGWFEPQQKSQNEAQNQLIIRPGDGPDPTHVSPPSNKRDALQNQVDTLSFQLCSGNPCKDVRSRIRCLGDGDGAGGRYGEEGEGKEGKEEEIGRARGHDGICCGDVRCFVVV
jgi:hypothetical protein